MEPTNVLPIVAILMLVEYGGWSLLTFISGREGLADWQKGFFRAGHAHAGVLLVLELARVDRQTCVLPPTVVAGVGA
jgi:hypothetical protein